jgi:hypothetical protein
VRSAKVSGLRSSGTIAMAEISLARELRERMRIQTAL